MSQFAWETQMALDNYDKEGHALARMDREDKLIAAVVDVLEEYNKNGCQSVSMETMSKLASAAQDVQDERRRKGIQL